MSNEKEVLPSRKRSRNEAVWQRNINKTARNEVRRFFYFRRSIIYM